MLRASSLWRGVSPFTLFLMDQKNNPALKGCAISKRGRILSKMYKELSQNQRRELKQRAARHPSLVRQSRDERLAAASTARGKHKGEFARFVRENYHKVRELNHRKRFSALSQLYDVSKPLEIEKELEKILPKMKEKVKRAVKQTVATKKKPNATTKAKTPQSGKKIIKEVAKKVKQTV